MCAIVPPHPPWAWCAGIARTTTSRQHRTHCTPPPPLPPVPAPAPASLVGGGDDSVAKKIAAVVGNGDVNTTPPDMAAAADVKREREFLVQLLESARGALCCFVRVPP